MPGLFEKLQAKLELFRLEQRYTRNRHRRSTFISNAIYKDGEYIYQTPNTTGSSTNSSAPSYPNDYDARRSYEDPGPQREAAESTAQRKKRNRLSMPGFGSSGKNSSAQEWRPNVVGVREVR